MPLFSVTVTVLTQDVGTVSTVNPVALPRQPDARRRLLGGALDRQDLPNVAQQG
jgi:hypothetical protein